MLENASSDLQFSTFTTGGTISYTDFSSRITTKNTNGFEKVSALITVPKGNSEKSLVYFGFEYYSGAGDVYIDNVSLVNIMSAEGINQNYSFEYQYEGVPANWSYSGDGEFVAQSEIMPDAETGEYTAKMTHISSNDASHSPSTI